MDLVTVTVRVGPAPADVVTLPGVAADATAADVLRRVLIALGLPADAGYGLAARGVRLAPGERAAGADELELLRPERGEVEATAYTDFDADDEVKPRGEPDAVRPPAPAPMSRARAAHNMAPRGDSDWRQPAETRRATVRYYSRMNPGRVYPLLVVLSREAVAAVTKANVAQRASGPFAVDVEAPVEVEPVLPGCDCYPPRVVARLAGGELTAAFRVVPRVLGKVDGASVAVRQNHETLAAVPLDMKVAQRTWALLSAAAAVVMPGVSALLKHFKLDFATQKSEGFNAYLSAANLVFDRTPPLALAAGFAALSVLLWWLTRPQQRDVFWDVTKVPDPASRG